jgi:hypothetical protein
MMITRFTKRCVVLMATLGLVLSTSGCFFNLSKEKDFKSWYFGEPGMAGALGETRCDPYADRIHGERHPYYLHFRTLEVLYQPQGGTRYPERSAATALDREGGRVAYACGIVDEGRETFNFNAVDAGLVDVIIPYRKATAVSGEAPQDYDTGSYAGSVVYNTGIAAVMKAPVYVVHDVLKTIYIPVAGTYFLFKSDEDTDAAAEALADGDGAPVPEAEREPPTAEKTVPEVVDTVDKVDGTPASMAAATETEASDTPSDEAVVASDDMRETATPETSDNEAVAPQATVAESQTAAEPPADHADAAPIETTDAIAAGDTQTGEAVEASESIPDRETVETPDTEVVEPSPDKADVEAVAAASTGTGDVPAVPVDGEDSVEPAEPAIIASEIETTETTPVAVAAVEEANQPGAEPEAVDASPDTTISEEDLTDVSTDREVAEPMATETVEGPQEEEAPMMAPATDVKASAGDITTPSMPEEETALPEMTDQDASVDIASVTEGQESHAGAASLPVQLEEVEISKRKLKKQVAFLGFLSRAATVDTQTKGFFEEKLWPAFMDECSRSVLMFRKGDPRFPNGLTQLSRDQFGRLNSFELTTVARFSGINAVVTGSVIDIRIANEISGILWYKEPEGALRVAILVEVYDAETGTKLLDKTLVHHTEVDELAPGSEGKLRDVDMPFVREALDSIASEMSEMVCDVLDDQPWRAFISGIDGSRITLSAGVDTGLVPGNILTVYNSQIIEGLNNQQFFLTGERVGRLQITQVFPDRSEANLIEGANLQDYSLVLPE